MLSGLAVGIAVYRRLGRPRLQVGLRSCALHGRRLRAGNPNLRRVRSRKLCIVAGCQHRLSYVRLRAGAAQPSSSTWGAAHLRYCSAARESPEAGSFMFRGSTHYGTPAAGIAPTCPRPSHAFGASSHAAVFSRGCRRRSHQKRTPRRASAFQHRFAAPPDVCSCFAARVVNCLQQGTAS